MNKVYNDKFVGAMVPDFYTAEGPAATATVVKVPASAGTISGRALGHMLSGKTAAQKAAIAAESMAANITFTKPTIGQIALLHGVSRSYLDAARALSPAEGARVARGARPLVDLQVRAAKALHGVYSDADVVRIINAIGPGRALDIIDMITAPAAQAAE